MGKGNRKRKKMTRLVIDLDSPERVPIPTKPNAWLTVNSSWKKYTEISMKERNVNSKKETVYSESTMDIDWRDRIGTGTTTPIVVSKPIKNNYENGGLGNTNTPAEIDSNWRKK